MNNLRRVTLVVFVAALACLDGWPFALPAQLTRAHAQGGGRRTPQAVAGPNQVIAGVGAVVTLDGSSSSDPAGLPLNYRWTFTEVPTGSTAALTGETTVHPTFVPDKKGAYRVRLVVDNGTQTSRPDVVVITVRNTPPSARAGDDRAAAVGQTVTLDGSGSTDADGDPLTYHWSFMSRPRRSRATLANSTSISPTFLVDIPGRYVVRLVVRDGQGRGIDVVNIDVPNTAPVANAGPDQPASVGARIRLDGSGSTDIDGDRLTYSWTFASRPEGSSAVLNRARTPRPNFVVDVPGRYVVGLVVHDGLVESAPDFVEISTGNTAPVANAGPDQSALVTQIVQLNGSASSDVDGDPLTYTWTFVSRPAGSNSTLTNATTVNPVFQVDRRGTYEVGLVVNDGVVDSTQDIVLITVGNTAPLAAAGPDQRVARGATVTLDGSGSTDVDGDALTYAWTLTSVPDGSTAALSNPDGVTTTFVADRSGTYVAQLVVSDGSSLSLPDTVSITTENVAPVADAGPGQTARVGQVVLLNGAGSSDADGDALTFRWSFASRPDGSVATLTDATAIAPSFVPDLPGEYVLQLIVNDGTLTSAPDTVTITTTNTAPVAVAGNDQIGVPVGSVVTLDGSGSFDADGQPLSYRWSLLAKPAGSSAEIGESEIANPTFTADVAGEYVAQLIVNDGVVDSAPDTVLIRTNQPLNASAGPDQTVEVGVTVQLDGGDSSDPNGETLTYEWAFTSRPAGSTAVLNGSTTSSPTFVPDLEGDYDVRLTVTNTSGSTASDSVTVTAVLPVPSINVPESAAFPDTDVGAVSPGDVTISNTGRVPVTFGVANATGDFTVVQSSSTCLQAPLAAGATCVIRIAFAPTATGARSGVLTIASDADGSPHSVTLTGIGTEPESEPTVTVAATDASASESGSDVAVFTLSRSGSFTAALTVNFTLTGTATNGSDYTTVPLTATIPEGDASATVTIAPIADGIVEGTEDVVLTLADGDYTIGSPGTATATIADLAPIVTVTATDASASEAGPDSGTFTVARTGPTDAALAVNITLTGTATNGADYTLVPLVVTIPTGSASAAVAINPFVDSAAEGTETVVLTVASGAYTIGGANQAVVAIADIPADGGSLINGANHRGRIATAGEIDVWTFFANAGESIVLNIGEVGTNTAFVPWIRLAAPNDAVIGNNWGALAAQFRVIAPATGVYRVWVASADSGNNDVGDYVLASVRTPGVFVVPLGDEGGGMTNGGNHAGTLHLGDLDPWTFTAAAGDSIVLNIAETGLNSDLVPWIRLMAPNGDLIGNNWGDLAAQFRVIAPAAGVYTVVVSTADSANDATGSYLLTLVHTPGAFVVPDGDQGGTLANGGNHAGTLHLGDLDPWSFTAAAGDSIIVNIAETGANSAMVPWIRLLAPNGDLIGNNWGDLAAQFRVIAPTAGVYTVVVSTADAGNDATGTYLLTLVHTPAPFIVPIGDEGGSLTNGANHAAALHLGDLDPWSFTAGAGDSIVVNIAETGVNSAMVPWIRLLAPNGDLIGNNWGDLAAQFRVIAPTTGVYTLVVSTADAGNDATGTYLLTLVHTPGAFAVPAGDEGGGLTNGANHTGTLHLGDLDPWSFTAAAGDSIVVNIGETGTNSAMVPWIRLLAPNGDLIGNNWGDLAAQFRVIAPTSGTYTVIVSTADAGNDATGTYILTLAHTPGAFVVPADDQGGALTNGGNHSGTLHLGDLDSWTFSAAAGNRIVLNISEAGANTAFVPWIRLLGPTGVLVGNNWGDLGAQVNVIAAATGTYTVVVSTADSGNDASGDYVLSRAVTPN
jgi:hypothetical protein